MNDLEEQVERIEAAAQMLVDLGFYVSGPLCPNALEMSHWSNASSNDMEMNPRQVLSYTVDPDRVQAEILKVSKKHLLDYKSFVYAPQCAALTKAKKPCRGAILPFPTIYEYDSSRDYLCLVHARIEEGDL